MTTLKPLTSQYNIVLNLPIKNNWFTMIRVGGKKEEYRGFNVKQVNNLYKKLVIPEQKMNAPMMAVFRNGYSMGSPALAVEVLGVEIRNNVEAKHPEWGEPCSGNDLHYVIKLGKVLMIAPYHDIWEVLT